jgi:hypothetical protein
MITQVLGIGCVSQDNIFGWESCRPTHGHISTANMLARDDALDLYKFTEKEMDREAQELGISITQHARFAFLNDLWADYSKWKDICNREFYHADNIAQDGANADKSQ